MPAQQRKRKSDAVEPTPAPALEATAPAKTVKFGKLCGLDSEFMSAILADRPDPVWVILTQGGQQKIIMSTEAFVSSFSDRLRRKLEQTKAAMASCPQLEQPKKKKQKKAPKKGSKRQRKQVKAEPATGPAVKVIEEPVDRRDIPVVRAELQGELTSPSIDFWAALFRTAIANRDLITAENYSQLVQDADFLAGDLADSAESELLNYLYNHFMKFSFARQVTNASNFRPGVINTRLFAELMRRVMDTHSIEDIFTEPGWKDVIEAYVKRNNNLIPTELTELALSGSAMKNLPPAIQEWIAITMDTQCEKQIPASMTPGFFGRGLIGAVVPAKPVQEDQSYPASSPKAAAVVVRTNTNAEC